MRKVILYFIFCSLFITHCFAQWVRVSNGIGNNTIRSFAVNGNDIFAGAEYNVGVYLSTNSGENWVQTSLNNPPVWSMAVNGNNVFAGTDGGVYKSTNNGTNWTQTSLNYRIVHALAVKENYIFAGTENYGVYISTDNGTSWTQTSLSNDGVWSFAVNGNYIFAGSRYTGVYFSTNNGTTWIQTSLNTQTVWSMAVNGNNVFAGTNNNTGLYVSTNNGTNWTQTPLNNRQIWSLAVSGNYIIAGTNNNFGVYVSSDNGASWIQRNEGFVNINYVFALSILNNHIFAGANVTSVWRRPLGELTALQPISNEIPNQYSISQNYPNPFNPTTHIKFQIPKSGFVLLKVYDALGREISTLVNEQLNPGTYETIWDASNYPSGVYYYSFQSGDFGQTKKMILMK
jgi:Secretion system C-terminal sorting domain